MFRNQRDGKRAFGRVAQAVTALAVALALGTGTAWATTARIDVNSADAAVLAELPGIGPAKAAAIVAERKLKPFASLEDLERVRGLGPATVEALKDHIVVKPRS